METRSAKTCGLRTNVCATNFPTSKSRRISFRTSCVMPRATGSVGASPLPCIAAPPRHRLWISLIGRPAQPLRPQCLRHLQRRHRWQLRLQPLLHRPSPSPRPVCASRSMPPRLSLDRELQALKRSPPVLYTMRGPSRAPPRTLGPHRSPIAMAGPPLPFLRATACRG